MGLTAMIENIAVANIAFLTSKLDNLTLNEISKVTGLPEKVTQVKGELEIIHAILADLPDDDSLSKEMLLWRNNIKELGYDMEDAIDKLTYISNNRDKDFESYSDDEEEYTFNDIVETCIGTIKKCIDSITDLPAKYGIAKEIDKLKDRIQQQQHKKIKKSDTCGTSEQKVNLQRMFAINSDPDRLVAINERSEHIMSLLDLKSMAHHDGCKAQSKYKVVWIVGSGGFGKTTLAGRVLDKVKTAEEFICSGKVFVTQNPEPDKILQHILQEFGYKEKKQKELKQLNLLDLSELLKKYIQDKRYFLVVDDIWDTTPWEVIKSSLFHNKQGGRIIVTTRMKELATRYASSDNIIHDIEPLGNTDAEKLLLKGVFSNGTCPSNLKEPFWKILKKCGGMPLAITTVSPLLVGKVTAAQWNSVYDSLNRADADPSIDIMRRIFWLSYYDLPHHLRTCLLYFSIFPEDMKIKRKRIINRWAAEGFIRAEDGEDINEKGKQYFDELVNKSLIQPVNIKYDGEARACRVHDIIHEYIIIKAVEENFVTLQLGDGKYRKSVNKFRRLSVQNTEDGVIKLEKDISHVRSLTVFGKIKEIPYQKIHTPLRVLDLEDATIQDQTFLDITKHPHLRYLTLTSEDEMAPEGIELLKNLETIHFGRNILMCNKLTPSIANLRQLVRLYVDSFLKLPVAVTDLVALQELKGFNIATQLPEFLQNLSKLVNLRVLGIHWHYICPVAHGAENEMLLVTSLRKLLGKSLQSISLDGGDEGYFKYEKPHISEWFMAVQDAVHDDQSTMKLRKFCMTHGYIHDFPIWLCPRLNQLEKLRLGLSDLQQEDLETLSILPSLLYLFLDLDTIPFRDDKLLTISGFKYLKFFGANSGPFIFLFKPGSMPCLQHLELKIHPIATKDIHHGFGFGLQFLSHVPMVDITIAYDFENSEAKQLALQAETDIKAATKKFSKHSTIKIKKEYDVLW